MNDATAMFNTDDFMNGAVDPLATEFVVVPKGEFVFLLDADPKQLVFNSERNGPGLHEVKGTSKDGKDYHFWEWVFFGVCQDESVKKKVGRDVVKVRLRINLDVDAGALASGKFALETGPNKNVALGQLRAALNQNNAGWTPKALLGAGPFIGKVDHDSTGRYADIVKVAALRR